MAEHFYEISIEGRTGRTLGFVQGFLTARGEGGRIMDAYREGCDTAGAFPLGIEIVIEGIERALGP